MKATKTVIITGTSRGIGFELVHLFANAGYHVLALSRNAKPVSNLNFENITALSFDLSKSEDYDRVEAFVKKEWTHVDILINNAGTNIPEPFEKIKQESMNYLVDLNLKAAFNVAQLVVKKMLKNKKRGGSIINMSSQLGHVGMSGRNVYNMTKFGIEGLTKGMGVELAKNNIRVNTVAPTFVATPMVKRFFKNKEFKKLALGNIPMGKLATESDVATSVCFLASSASSMITATSILVDGGWTAK